MIMEKILRITYLAGLVVMATVPALAAPPSVQPGRWESTTRIVDMVAPGLPPQALQMMKGRPITVSYCVTPEDAAQGPQKMLEQSQKNNGDCKMLKHEISGNRMNAEMQCSSKDMGNSRITMQGEFAETAYNMNMAMESSGGPFQKMSSTMTAKRIGAC